MVRVLAIAAVLGMGCSGRTLQIGPAGDGIPGPDASEDRFDGSGFPDAPPDAQPPDAGVDVVAWRCAPHSADTPWCANEPISVPAQHTNAEPALSVDSDERAVSGWISGSFSGYAITAAGATDGFDTMTSFASPGTYAFDPALAVDGQRAYLVYLTTDYTTSTLWAVASDDGGLSWSSPVQINDNVSMHDRPWVSVAPGGDVVVGWKEGADAGGPAWHRVAVSSDRGASFAQVGWIAGAETRAPPESPIGFAADGAMVWVFTEFDGSAVSAVYARSLDGGASFTLATLDNWAAPESPTTNDEWRHYQLSYQVSVAAAGGPVYVAYARPTGTWQRDLYAMSSGDGVSFGGAVRVNENSGAVSHMFPQLWLAADERGGAHVAWYEQRSGFWGVYESSAPAGSGWSAVVPISDEVFSAGDWGPALEQDTARWPGHFFGLSAHSGHLYAAWGDIRTGQSLIYFAQTAYPVY
jgi:hypothetical protein